MELLTGECKRGVYIRLRYILSRQVNWNTNNKKEEGIAGNRRKNWGNGIHEMARRRRGMQKCRKCQAIALAKATSVEQCSVHLLPGPGLNTFRGQLNTHARQLSTSTSTSTLIYLIFLSPILIAQVGV